MWLFRSLKFDYCDPETEFLIFSSVQSLSHVQLFATQWTAAGQASLSITNSQSLPRLVHFLFYWVLTNWNFNFNCQIAIILDSTELEQVRLL